MIRIDDLIKTLKKNKVNFFTGVPDSILKNLSIFLQNKKKKEHVLAVNEGSAVSIGIGYYLSSKKIPCIYLQNSGLSNAINPIISLAHKNVYSIPIVLLIGWRGSPGIKDEPQHETKGKITTKILELLGIKYLVLKKKDDLKKFNELIKKSSKKNIIVAGLIEKNTLVDNKAIKVKNNSYNLNKEIFYFNFLKKLKKNDRIISSTGYNSRELFFYRQKYNIYKGKDFYLVGGMGYTASLSLGFSINNKKNNIICLDGDGSFLMHMGSMNTFSNFGNKNLKYLLINNNSHDSVGGQTTFLNKINLRKLSLSLGFKNYYLIRNKFDLNKNLEKFLKSKSLSFLEVRTSINKIKDLPRPKNLVQVKKRFII